MRTDRQTVGLIFRALRRTGIFARQSYSCCQGCAWDEAEEERGGKPFVFYHQQDAEAFDRNGNLTRPLMIRFGTGNDDSAEDAALGHLVAGIADSRGADVRWSMKPADCIEIHPSSAHPAEKAP
jgi:hypothetical protein